MAEAAAQDPPLPGEDVKPFTPEKAKEIVMCLQQPAVFCNMVFDWPVLYWNAKYLSEVLDGKTIRFRIGMKKRDAAPQFETKCSYVEATLEEFLAWTSGQPTCVSRPFSCYDSSKYWAYADYKYIARIFEDKTEIFKDIMWSDFGFPGRNGKESTLWIGSAGANTPCHLDSYGCNLVLQIQGRIPYEESSIFSKVNVVNPDLKHYPRFTKAQAHVVTLNPGQVLFVPRHWWHYVESVDPITVSINSWIELDADHKARVEEAITRTLVCAIKSAENPSPVDAWLNPTEVEATSHEINLQYLNGAMSAYLEYQKVTVSEDRDPSTHDTEKEASSCKRRKIQVNTKPEDYKSGTHEAGFTVVKAKKFEKIPFGVHLIPVLPQSQEASSVGAGAVESDSRDLLSKNEGGHFGKSRCTGKQSVMSNDCETLADQTDSDSTANSSQMAISTNDLLDCLVNPQVVSLVAGLLLERERV
ncbi:HSPB1-associated protein 1 isoform X2 [Terrapene carolina triunguis]|uniref:HSPB1-associated protein 1 isoform X2 n=1 Tax=Terrapene triunguis TaxID=2587831 RepID=UPI000E776F07|nr:HSPB1-associated protein 1 isoform X2 [Terrapene carolina triunguis]